MARSQRDYWRFYWPLALMGAVALVGRLAQNRVLMGFEKGVTELAVFTLALAAFGPFRASLIFVPQMSNVLVRGPKSSRSCLRFLITICLVFTLPVVLLGWTQLGAVVLPRIYKADAERVALLQAYLRYFTPLVVIAGTSGFVTGLLVQARRTGMVTLLRAVHIGLLVGMLAVGIGLRMSPIPTIGMSMLLAGVGQLILAGVLHAKFGSGGRHDGDRTLRQGEIAAFFLPMVVTTIFFSLSRPIIFGFLTGLNPEGDPNLPDVDAMVSAVGLAFTLNMLFQAAINQFRNLLVTFGRDDPEGVARFMRRATLVMTALMVVAVASPFAGFFLRRVQDARGDVLTMARQALWPLCLVPAIVAWRNYCHGMTMVHRRTGLMVAGGVARNVSVLVCAPVLVGLGLYNHVTAAVMLALAFAAEAATVSALIRLSRGRPPGPGTEPPEGGTGRPGC